MFKKWILLLIIIISTSSIVSAADQQEMTSNEFPTNPLIVDQAYTNGDSNWLISVNSGYTSLGKSFVLMPTVSYGVMNNLDIILGLKDPNLLQSPSFSIIGMDIGLKILFLSDDIFALSVKNSFIVLSLPTIFSGKIDSYDFDISLIGSMKIGESLILHENIGYDSIDHGIHLTTSGEYMVLDQLAITLTAGTHQFGQGELFVMGGAIYALTNTIYIDLGVSVELKGSDDIDGLLGIAFKL